MARERDTDSRAAAVEGAAIADALTAWWREAERRPSATPSFTAYPFSLGMASGAPRPASVVLWTRLAPEPLNGGGLGDETIPVRWELAHDELFAQPVQNGSADAVAARAHSVHVEVTGLEPARWYFYRFTAGAEVSPTGRTRTAPAATAAHERLRFAFASCHNFEHGFYAAHRHAADEDLELMVFLGDYIYESSSPAPQARRHVGGEARTLADYRTRHAQYKTDPDLQRLHAAVPWLVTWDDHEVDNNYARNRSETLDPQFVRRRTAAYRAYFEHMPLPELARPVANAMQLRARYDIGTLARFHVLDGRQHRTPQACPRLADGDGPHREDHRRATPLGHRQLGRLPRRPQPPARRARRGSRAELRGADGRRMDEIRADNAHVRFAESTRRGYVVVDLTAERCVARFRVVEDAADPLTPVSTQATFVVEAGRPGPQPG